MLTQFVEVEGVQTRCITSEDRTKPPLLLVHGLTLTSEIWLRNIDELGRERFVVATDLLGHGFTRPRRGSEAVGIEEKIRHLVKLADVLELERFALSGSSYGALIAANLFLANKDRVEKLIINGSGSCFNTEPQLLEFIDRLYKTYRPVLTRSSPAMWRKLLAGTFFEPQQIPVEFDAILPLCYAQPWISNCWEHTIQTMLDPNAFRPFRILERLEEIDVDTLVVWGKNDRGGVLESAQDAVARMPRARLVVFDECGHLPMVEQPRAYNEALCGFLGGGHALE